MKKYEIEVNLHLLIDADETGDAMANATILLSTLSNNLEDSHIIQVKEINTENECKTNEYEDFLNLLKDKSKDAIRIKEKNNNLSFLGEYVEEFPEIHVVEIYKDINGKIYKLDKI